MTTADPMGSPRKIIHIDADSFYASVEIREKPELKNLPVAVGGSPDHRGVVATCNYVARGYGVHSAMASARAVQLCPDLIFLRPNFPLYKAVSSQMHAIFRQYTSIIQPLSLDEAYLDVTGSLARQGSATLIAEAIRREIQAQLGITVSAGIAPNKFLAKVASDWNKPDGSFTIAPAQVAAFVKTLPVTRINGVGKVTAAKMKQLGILTCGDLQRFSEADLVAQFGSWGPTLFRYARGADDRPVQTSRERKSLSVERTFDRDLHDTTAILKRTDEIFRALLERFEPIRDRYGVTKRFVKVKCFDFTQTTLEEMLPASDARWQDLERYHQLVLTAVKRHNKPIRLLGLGVRVVPLSGGPREIQYDLFETISDTDA